VGEEGGKLRESNRTRTVPVSSCEIFCQFTRNFPPPGSLPPPRDLCALAAEKFSSPRRHDGVARGYFDMSRDAKNLADEGVIARRLRTGVGRRQGRFAGCRTSKAASKRRLALPSRYTKTTRSWSAEDDVLGATSRAATGRCHGDHVAGMSRSRDYAFTLSR